MKQLYPKTHTVDSIPQNAIICTFLMGCIHSKKELQKSSCTVDNNHIVSGSFSIVILRLSCGDKILVDKASEYCLIPHVIF